ncbi:MAG TPA: SRPBCC family protein [Myxococcales bacterium]|jgi:uncharacterized protein YndB with AHSA1/START domain|nr:SRPBCC family protein [Myxococcales bacterium]
MKWLGIGALGLPGLIAVTLAALWMMGRRADAGRLQASVDIDRAPADVWPWITDGDKEKAWVTWLAEVKNEGPSRQIWTLHNVNNGARTMDIVSDTISAEPGRKLAVKLSAPGMFTGKATYLLTDLGNGKTRLSCDTTYRYQQALTQFLEPLITPQALKKFNGDLLRLKSAAEASPLATR